jgi:hypothetical protein
VKSACPAAQRPALRAFPFGGFRPSVAAPCRSPCPALPLVKVRCSSESCLRPDCGGIGFPASAEASAFLPGPADLSDRHPPRAFARGFILPRAFRLLQSTATDDLPSVPRTTSRPSEGQRAPPLGFQFPHRDISRRRPLVPGVPTPRADGPSSTFRTSSTVCSATCLAGLFRPAAASRVCPSGVCPSPRSRTGFRRPSHALLPLDGGACGLTRAGDPILVFRALLPAESAVTAEPVRAPSDPRPSWASPPPGLPSPHRGNAFAFPPPTTFTATSPLRPVLGVSPVRGSVCLGPGYRPARGFWPEPPPSFRKTGSRPRVWRPTGPPDTQDLGARLVPARSLRN